MSAESLDADELIVKAELISEFAESEFSLNTIHRRLANIMDLEGYQPIEPRKSILNTRTIKYTQKSLKEEKSLVQRVIEGVSLKSNEPKPMDYHNQLEKTRDDVPYEVEYRFLPLENEKKIELRTRVTVTPAVVLQHQQLEPQENYNAQNIVRSCKEFTKTIAAEFGWGFIAEPHTPANTLRATADEEMRATLTELEYGQKVIQFSDEGDEALKYGLDHSALASYIHAIEWAIVAHLKDVANFDVLEKEEGGPGFSYKLLVDLLEEHGESHQTTIENLKKHQTDRRIMAHHKSGKLSTSHVHSVKETLKNLMEDSFRDHQFIN